MDLWNSRLNRENFTDFYLSTVDMVYVSTYGICKETTRTENAIVKSYIETFQQRSTINGEDVLYVFGDILLKNAEEIVEKYPLPEGITYASRVLDEYTRNSMLEKINAKLDSAGYKVAEFISSDSKKGKPAKAVQRILRVFPVTPLLAIQLILLAIVIWVVSSLSVSVINRDGAMISEDDIYETADLQDKYVAVLDYYPLHIEYSVTGNPGDGDYVDSEISEDADPVEIDNGLGPVIAETTEPEPSATRG